MLYKYNIKFTLPESVNLQSVSPSFVGLIMVSSFKITKIIDNKILPLSHSFCEHNLSCIVSFVSIQVSYLFLTNLSFCMITYNWWVFFTIDNDLPYPKIHRLTVSVDTRFFGGKVAVPLNCVLILFRWLVSV